MELACLGYAVLSVAVSRYRIFEYRARKSILALGSQR